MEITAGTVITLVIAVLTIILGLCGFLANMYWNQKNFNNGKFTALEDKVDKLQIQAAEHESRFDLVVQKIDTTEVAIAKSESSMTATLDKMQDKMDRMLDWMYTSNSK